MLNHTKQLVPAAGQFVQSARLCVQYGFFYHLVMRENLQILKASVSISFGQNIYFSPVRWYPDIFGHTLDISSLEGTPSQNIFTIKSRHIGHINS